MMNRAFYMGGGTANPLHTRERRQGTVICLSPTDSLRKGGLRWNNTSETGGVMYG